MVGMRMERALAIPCKVWPGWFSNERGVEVDIPGAHNIVIFVDKSDVIVKGDISAKEAVRGWIKIHVIRFEDDSAIVDLPQPSLTEGTRIRIPKSYIEEMSL